MVLGKSYVEVGGRLSDISSELSDVTLPSQPLVCTDN